MLVAGFMVKTAFSYDKMEPGPKQVKEIIP